ncbi:hypothetical protein [Natrinema sp. 1APR25-10V2]|uniref:hypothetical protein n=1 Tax=Natrinema sp. 1APR25-10V2 TaxID=2951081 RepID=UPI002876C099|nr:hypothetical protein [Natrinema sp. 1APR25-10V2]MDS0475956.1 hypothetical protein [Natrinema sp. 1APR25-10V2]
MSGISTSAAIWYGIKHMVYMGVVYVIGFFMMGLGLAFAIESEPLLGLGLAGVGIIVIFGGLHGAIYKMAGDATARVMERSTPTAQKVPSADESSRNDTDSAEIDSIEVTGGGKT